MQGFNFDSKLFNTVKKIVYIILRKENLLQGQWHIGTVKTVLSPYMLDVYVDGSENSQKIPCNPDIKFLEGEKIWILYINGDNRNKFVPFKRATGGESIGSIWKDDRKNNIYYNNGNVGIGTSTPTKKLEVIGTSKSDDFNVKDKYSIEYNETEDSLDFVYIG